ncbi:CsiV family protein [Methylomarinum vadi]|uniref:CsiV family protein n=1 Tax=Methylomarinum vadi TaxID=438855 RepID=UPI0004DF24A1|nr:CsiV family protein [Methylomarinum vadi]
MEKYFFTGLIGLWLAVFSAAGLADSKAFKIEVVVFAQDQPTSEVLDQLESEIDWPRRLADLNNYPQVDPQYISLNGISAKLRRTAGYRPLLHVAWTQEVPADSIGTAVQLQNPSGSLNGFIRIQRGHYLYLIADMEYNPTGSLYYRLDEKRRIKLNEIHYLDHPKFGIIARVTPLS